MKTTVEIESIACSACINSILKAVSRIRGVFGTQADTAGRAITIEHTDEVSRQEIEQVLRQAGCTVKGDAEPPRETSDAGCCQISKTKHKSYDSEIH